VKSKSYKIIADANIPLAMELFSSLGQVQLIDGRNLCRSDLQYTDILLVRSVTQVNKALLAETPVKFVGTATIGTDHIDLQYLESNNIAFASAPGCNANSVKEYVLSALAHTQQLQRLLRGEITLAIVGLGNVGSRLYQVCHQLGIKVVCFDPFLQEAGITQLHLDPQVSINWASWQQILKADILTLHVPLTKTGKYPTYHLFNQESFEGMKSGALLINSSRGGVVDNLDLLAALKQKKIQAILDVWEHEPNISTELRDLCLLSTPHIAGYSQDGKEMGTKMLFQALCQFLGGNFDSQEFHGDNTSYRPSRTIEWNNHWQSFECVEKIINLAYSIEIDSRNLCGVSEKNMGTEFDLLRRDYPARHEFLHWFIQGCPENQQLALIKTLGFQFIL